MSAYGALFVMVKSTIHLYIAKPMYVYNAVTLFFSFEYYSTCIDGRLACFEIQCSFADCLNSYIPEGACCPVCPPTEMEGG